MDSSLAGEPCEAPDMVCVPRVWGVQEQATSWCEDTHPPYLCVLAHEVVRKHERTTYTREQAPNKAYIHPGKYSVQLAKVVQKRRAPLTPLTTNAKVPRLCRCEELEKRVQLLEEELRKARVALNTPSNAPTERSELTDFLTKADQRVASWMKASREANKRLLDHERQQRRKADRIIAEREHELARLKKKVPRESPLPDSPLSRWGVTSEPFYLEDWRTVDSCWTWTCWLSTHLRILAESRHVIN